jgi:hypothetical protein
MPSTEIRKVISTAWASIGSVSNEEHRLVDLGKAGRARHMGLRPKTRGSAKNAVITHTEEVKVVLQEDTVVLVRSKVVQPEKDKRLVLQRSIQMYLLSNAGSQVG